MTGPLVRGIEIAPTRGRPNERKKPAVPGVARRAGRGGQPPQEPAGVKGQRLVIERLSRRQPDRRLGVKPQGKLTEVSLHKRGAAEVLNIGRKRLSDCHAALTQFNLDRGRGSFDHATTVGVRLPHHQIAAMEEDGVFAQQIKGSPPLDDDDAAFP